MAKSEAQAAPRYSLWNSPRECWSTPLHDILGSRPQFTVTAEEVKKFLEDSDEDVKPFKTAVI